MSVVSETARAGVMSVRDSMRTRTGTDWGEGEKPRTRDGSRYTDDSFHEGA